MRLWSVPVAGYKKDMTTHASIITLNEYSITSQIFDNPTFHESILWILKPNVSLAGKVIFAFYAADHVRFPPHILAFDK